MRKKLASDPASTPTTAIPGDHDHDSGRTACSGFGDDVSIADRGERHDPPPKRITIGCELRVGGVLGVVGDGRSEEHEPDRHDQDRTETLSLA